MSSFRGSDAVDVDDLTAAGGADVVIVDRRWPAMRVGIAHRPAGRLLKALR